jgi:alkaline phosphatase D
VLDTRQYRTVQACGNGVKPACDVELRHLDPKGTLMGAAQEKWLFDGLGRSRGPWNLLLQQVMMAKIDWWPGLDARYSYDQWDGYEVERNRLFAVLSARRIANPVVLAGDVHNHWVCDLKADFADPGSPTIATEFVGTSISSGGDGGEVMKDGEAVVAKNPCVKFHNDRRGYVSCEITWKAMRADYRVVDYVTREGAPLRTTATFKIDDGKPGAIRI